MPYQRLRCEMEDNLGMTFIHCAAEVLQIENIAVNGFHSIVHVRQSEQTGPGRRIKGVSNHLRPDALQPES